MKWFFVMSLISPLTLQAQVPGPNNEVANYFTDSNKEKVVSRLQNKILNGCTKPIEEGLAIVPEELDYRVKQIKSLLEDKFSKSFSENPKIKEALFKDLDAINKDSYCQQEGNDCRTRLVAVSIYYFQNLRPDIVGCKDYVAKESMTKGYDGQCEMELKYRNQALDYYGRANGGMDARGAYTDSLIQQLNVTTSKVFKDVLHRTIASPTRKKPEVKDPVNLNICESVESGVVYSYPLKMSIYKDPIAHAEPNKGILVEKAKVVPCVEEKMSLYSEFVPLNFDEGRSTVGIDQITPVQKKIQDFITSHPDMVITDVSVASNSSRTPFSKDVNGKKVMDPESDAKNIKLAKERAIFAEKALNELKINNSTLEKVNIAVSSGLAGPEYSAIDLNNRFVTKLSPDYEKRVSEVFFQNKEIYEKEALIKSSADLMNESRFSNLYQAKYKPFQGFKINISGYKKDSMKCPDTVKGGAGNTKPASANKASKQ